MGGFVPIAVSTGLQVAQHVEQQKQVKAAAEATSQQQALQSQLLWQQQGQRAKQQRDLLMRQMASARASLAAGGIGFGSGSGQALMEGIARQAEESIADDYRSASLRNELRGIGRYEGNQRLANAQFGFNLLRPLIS